MTVVSNQSGSQTATIGTEHTLGAAITAAGAYVLKVNTRNMVNGDVLELRIKSKILSGSGYELDYFMSYVHVQSELNKFSVPVPIDIGMTCTLKQTAGVGRVFDWSILAL